MEEMKTYWWEGNEGNINEQVFAVVRFLIQNQAWVGESHQRNMRLYGNLNVLGLSAHTYSQATMMNPPWDRMGYNIVQSQCDTVTQKVSKSKVRPMFLTEGGDFKLQKKAKLLTKFIDGVFYQTKTYEKAPYCFRDSTVFGSGFMKIYRSGKEIVHEKTYPGEILVDENEGVDGNPRSMYQIKLMPKEYAAKLWPEYADKIKTAPSASWFQPTHKYLSGHLMVAEAWHLPANENSKDGRHVICIEGADLLDEVWEKNYFPFAKIDWSKRLRGYIGQGLAEQLTGLQIEINKILRDIQITMHLFKPKVLLEMGSKIIKSQVNNEIGTLLWYEGIKPEIWIPEAVPQSWFIHLQNLFDKSYQISGISQLSAGSQKPSGLNSGKALREFSDIETERFILTGQEWEAFHLEIAKQDIQLAKEIAEEYGDFDVMVAGKDKLERIKWKEVNLKEDQYMMKVYPTNFFSNTPSGKLSDIQELAQAGFIDKDMALRLLDFPDLEAFTKWANAPTEDIISQIWMIIENGKYNGPEPFQSLSKGISLFQSAYLWAKDNDVPEERLELLRRWMEEAKIMLDQTQAELAMQQQQAQQQAIPARPESLPTNELLPQG